MTIHVVAPQQYMTSVEMSRVSARHVAVTSDSSPITTTDEAVSDVSEKRRRSGAKTCHA